MIYNIALSCIRTTSVLKLRALLDAFGSAENIFCAPKDAFDGLGSLAKNFVDEKKKSELMFKAEENMKFIADKKLKAVHLFDDAYPYRLKECPDAPLLMYLSDGVDLNKGRFVSVVGTRRCSSYGVDLTNKLVGELKDALGDELTIVSGLAHGIDVAAHRAALANGVKTYAVVAHGLDTIYPAVNRNVAVAMIKNNGAIITEYPIKTQALPANFLQRNRIVAGMCDALVVVESAAKGGALVTAGIANSYGRSVYAFPGRVGDKASEGCNMLLRTTQAGLIQSASDLINAESWTVTPKPKQAELFSQLDPQKQKLLNILQSGALHVADIALEMNLKTNALSPLLIEMELDGLIQGIAGARYRCVIR